MVKNNLPGLRILNRPEPLRLGFLPVNDCAPLVVAHELGYFDKYSLKVVLQREQSWAAIRDGITENELDAAQAPAPMPVTMSLGVNSELCMCVTGLVLSLSGNAITLSQQLWREGGHHPLGLAERMARKPRLTFAVPQMDSVQAFLLRRWLGMTGLEPDVKVRLIILPPAQMFPNLKLGNIDGFCVDEPWNSVAVQAGVGVCVATSSQLMPLHPEKVLLARESFAESRPDEHERLIAALIEAGAFCDQPKNRRVVARLLAQREYVNAPMEALEPGLVGPFSSWNDRARCPMGLNVFSRYLAGEPSRAKLKWILDQLCEPRPAGCGFVRAPLEQLAREIYRLDIFRRAQKLVAACGTSQNILPDAEAFPQGERMVA